MPTALWCELSTNVSQIYECTIRYEISVDKQRTTDYYCSQGKNNVSYGCRTGQGNEMLFNDLLWLSSSNIIKPATVWEVWFESVAYLIAYLCSPTKILSPNRNLLTCPGHRLGKEKDIEVTSGGRPQKAT